jgi:hypothetical protein
MPSSFVCYARAHTVGGQRMQPARYHQTVAGIQEYIMAFHDACGGIITGELGDRRCSECGQSVSDRELAAEYHELSHTDRGRVQVSVSEECAAGDCTACPGMLETKGAVPVFCSHGCHRAAGGAL